MLGILLIPIENGRGVKTYGVKYYNNIYNIMKNIICLFILTIVCVNCVYGDIEFYPGFRRPDPIIKWDKEQAAAAFNLEFLEKIIREQQRLLQAEQEESTFRYLEQNRENDDIFGVAPTDPRYYEPIPEEDFYQRNDYEEDQDEDDTRDNEVEEQQLLLQQQQRERQQQYLQQQQQQQILQQEQQKKLQYFHEELEELKEQNKPEQQEQQQIKSNHIPNNIDKNPSVKLRSDELTHQEHVQPIMNQNKEKLIVSDQLRGNAEQVYVKPVLQDDTAGVYVIAVVAGISAAATVGLIAFGIGWYNLQKNVKSATDVEYPAYGVTGPNKDVSPTGDRRLAQSAQMYHYQHQKQQIIAMERTATADRHGSLSEAESDEENEEGDYTVYECPGLAPTGEMEVKNPLFQDDTTPATQATPKTEQQSNKK